MHGRCVMHAARLEPAGSVHPSIRRARDPTPPRDMISNHDMISNRFRCRSGKEVGNPPATYFDRADSRKAPPSRDKKPPRLPGRAWALSSVPPQPPPHSPSSAASRQVLSALSAHTPNNQLELGRAGITADPPERTREPLPPRTHTLPPPPPIHGAAAAARVCP